MDIFLFILPFIVYTFAYDKEDNSEEVARIVVRGVLADQIRAIQAMKRGSSKSAHAWISFKLHTLFAQVPAAMKIGLFSRTKKSGSQESSLMYTCDKCITVSKPTSIKSTIQHDV